jgi:hypothetical protein
LLWFSLAEQDHAALDFGPVGKDLPRDFVGLVLLIGVLCLGGALCIFSEYLKTLFDLGFYMEW